MPPFLLSEVERVEFFKRDEVTTDLICCEIALLPKGKIGGLIFAHEEMPHWEELIRKLEFLGGFDVEWFSHVSQPPFAENRYDAFQRANEKSRPAH